jgi:NAD-dependent deacetylase
VKKKVVILSGAGISAESGLGTFRDSGGLWENYNIEDVATWSAWEKNPALVLNFYDMRRKQAIAASPNEGHRCLVELEKYYDVQIITQNIDDLHERAGSSNVIHLHGEILKGKSVHTPERPFTLEKTTIKLGDLAADGGQIRPHVVWFGEAVPMMMDAEILVEQAQILIVVGTSLNVYPAANLIYQCPLDCAKYLVDPNDLHQSNEFKHLKGPASKELPRLVDQLIQESKKDQE